MNHSQPNHKSGRRSTRGIGTRLKQAFRQYGPAIWYWLKRVVALFLILSVTSVLALRWIHPITSSFMIQRQIKAWWNGNENFELYYDWTDWEQISPYVKVAAVTSEDQRFAEHWGFDFEQIGNAIEEYRAGDDLRGASTITQQTAKNLFLCPAQNFVRKGIEAYFTILMELLLSKERILEIYLNIAAFGDGVFGVKAASNRYFGTSPAHVSMSQSALMVTALPNPDSYNLANPSSYMIQRRNWVLQYMQYLGGKNYLDHL